MFYVNVIKFYRPKEAERIAKMMTETDEDWSYILKPDPKGTGDFSIEIYDEEKEFVGYFNFL